MRFFSFLLFYSISLYTADKQGQFLYGNKAIASLKQLAVFQPASLSPQAATLLASYHDRKAFQSDKKTIRVVVNDSPYSLYVADLNQESSQFDKILKPHSRTIWDRSLHDSSHIRFQFYTLTPTEDEPTLGVLQGKKIDCYLSSQGECLKVQIMQSGTEECISFWSKKDLNITFTKQDRHNKVALNFF